MQFPAVAKPPVGVIFDTALNRIDEVLALAMLHGFQTKDQARIAAVGISNANLQAAQFVDAVRLFYASALTGPAKMFMHAPAVGLSDAKPAGPVPMLAVATESGIKSINDTAEITTLFRNALMAYHDQNAVVVLSGPAGDLVRLLDMYGVKDWIKRKVRLLSIANMPDDAASKKILAEWPTPIAIVGPEIGESLPFPGPSIDKDFTYSANHPIAAAYRAYRPMPYDAPSTAMAAMLHAVRPNDSYFKLTGNRLTFEPAQKDRILQAYIDLASAKPADRKKK